MKLQYLGTFTGGTDATFTVPDGTTTDDIFLRLISMRSGHQSYSGPTWKFSISGTTLTVNAQTYSGSAESMGQAYANGEVYLIIK